MNDTTRALEEIRRTEIEAAREVEAARARADSLVQQARTSARSLVDEGRERGRRTAEQRLADTIARAQSEAEEIRRRGHTQAAALEDVSAASVDRLVEVFVETVLPAPRVKGR